MLVAQSLQQAKDTGVTFQRTTKSTIAISTSMMRRVLVRVVVMMTMQVHSYPSPAVLLLLLVDCEASHPEKYCNLIG